MTKKNTTIEYERETYLNDQKKNHKKEYEREVSKGGNIKISRCNQCEFLRVIRAIQHFFLRAISSQPLPHVPQRQTGTTSQPDPLSKQFLKWQADKATT